jgi:hypothetical protein
MTRSNFLSPLLAILIAGLVICEVGCSRPTARPSAKPAVPAARRNLSAEEAAQFAAKLANDQCERQYARRPFMAKQHSAVLENDIYHWGGLDVGAQSGLSALVTFKRDGSEPHVEVYFSTDNILPRLR